MSVFTTAPEANQDSYLRVRVAFVARGTSLHAWCRDNGVAMSNVRAAFFGVWKGEKATALIVKVRAAAGVP